MKSSSFESLEFLLTPNKKGLYSFSFSGSACEELMKANFGKKTLTLKAHETKDVADIWQDESLIFRSSNLENVLKSHGITRLQLDTHSSNYKERWARDRGVKLTVSPWKMQKQFENKIFFDRFLRLHRLPVPDGVVLTGTSDLGAIKHFPVVLQVPDSNGSRGTFVVREKKELDWCIKNHRLSYPLLAREYVDNAYAVGVSLMIGSRNLVFSALRVQAYFQESDGSSRYYGIQWLPKKKLKPTLVDELEKVLKKLALSMQKYGFRGVANIDLMIRGDSIFLIECNPRLGGSTPQLSNQPALLHGLSFVREFSRITTGGELSENRPFIPSTQYEGFTMDLDAIAFQFYDQTMLQGPKSGFYRFSKTSLAFFSFRLEAFVSPQTILLYLPLPMPNVLTKDHFFGFSVTHFPLMKFLNGNWCFRPKGHSLIAELTRMVRKCVSGDDEQEF